MFHRTKAGRGFYASSTLMRAIGHLIAWENAAPQGDRRWLIDSDDGEFFEIVLVQNGHIEHRYARPESDVPHVIELMIDALGGTFEIGEEDS